MPAHFSGALVKLCAVSVAAFVLIESYYQLNLRCASVLPSFIRVYDQRYFDQHGTPRFAPNTKAWHRSYRDRSDVLVHINSHGFRGRNPSAERMPRIAMIGDSVLFNGGVRLEESFPYLVENAQPIKTGNQKFEVLNFGVGDINLSEVALKLKNHAIHYAPDLVMVFIYLNDSQPSMSSAFLKSSRGEHTPWYHSIAFEKLSKLYQSFGIIFQAHQSGKFRWVDLFQSREYLTDPVEWQELLQLARFDWGAAWLPESWEVIESSLRNIKETAQMHNSEVWVVLMPAEPQLFLNGKTAGLFKPQELAQGLAQKLKLKFLDPLSFLRERADKGSFYYDQCHLTAEGNRAIAEFLVPEVEEWVRNRPPTSAGRDSSFEVVSAS